MSKLTHFDETGRAAMVDVSKKAVTTRKAIAIGQVKMAAETLALVQKGNNKKGDVFSVAELAGIMGAKKTSDLIPLCHPLPLSKVNVRIEVDEALPGLTVSAETKTNGQTGVEMEALTIYDMLKAADKHMVIGAVMLTNKTGGKSGDWTR